MIIISSVLHYFLMMGFETRAELKLKIIATFSYYFSLALSPLSEFEVSIVSLGFACPL